MLPSPIKVGITGIGMSMPDKVLDNFYFEKLMDTTDEWIQSRTGIVERRFAEKNTPSSAFGIPSALEAIESAKLKPTEIDAIIVTTVTPDMFFPSTACIIQEAIGAKNAFCYDMNAACSGYLYGLYNAYTSVASGLCKNVLVVGADIMSSIARPDDRNIYPLFGDGAGSCVISRISDDQEGFLDFIQGSDGSGAQYLYMPGGGSLNPATHETIDANLHWIHMNGREVFKNAVRYMAQIAKDILDRNGYTSNDLKLLVAHQANLRIVQAVQERLQLPEEKVYVNINRYANTTDATLPTCLYEAYKEGKLKKGDLVILDTFGGGYTWGACLLKWIMD
jgi:3-oxoacyl-[acyl-carrier-protein] synthase III